MKQNKTSSRLIAAMAFFLIETMHGYLFDSANSDLEWASYYVCAGICDLLIIFIADVILDGVLRKNIQCINLLAMIANLSGFIMYFSYMNPNAYNKTIFMLSLIQYALLLFTNGYDIKHFNNFARRVVSGFIDRYRRKQNFKEA